MSLPVVCHINNNNNVNTNEKSYLKMCYRLGEITLHDFKGALDRPGQYRYHFKALDPEFGTVKEEV